MSKLQKGVVTATTAATKDKSYDAIQVRIDGQDHTMFADDDGELDVMETYMNGDVVEILSTSTKDGGNGRTYHNCKAGDILETAKEREKRIGDIDSILAEEYALTAKAVLSDEQLEEHAENLDKAHGPEEALEFLRSAISSVFIQKSRMVDFRDRAAERA